MELVLCSRFEMFKVWVLNKRTDDIKLFIHRHLLQKLYHLQYAPLGDLCNTPT